MFISVYRIRKALICGLAVVAAALVIWRAGMVVQGLVEGDETDFLTFPLAVILPALAFAFLALRNSFASAEGALMHLCAMLQLLLILAMPRFALLLALGFPVGFLLVELFETRCPSSLRDPLRRGFLE